MNNRISLSSYPELASQIKPGGFEITESYCAEVSKRALELLKLKGFVVEKGVPENLTVDRQNRLITLCMNAISEIRTFANAAFFDDLDYYNSNYASTCFLLIGKHKSTVLLSPSK